MGALLFTLSFLLYFATAAPVIFYEDNPEFITTAYTMGIAHAPGYALINMLGNAAGFLPVGGFAFRCNLLSAIFAAGAIFCFYRCAMAAGIEKRYSALAATALAVSGNFWSQSVIFEVYTLHFALAFALIWITLEKKLTDFRWLLFSSFLFGLGVTNHLSFSLVMVPVVLLWISQRKEWAYGITPFNLPLLPLSGLIGWTIQLYMPARSFSSSKEILFSWGRIPDIHTFASYITGAIYSSLPFNRGDLEGRTAIAADYISHAIPLWALIVVLPLAIYGLSAMFGQSRGQAVALSSFGTITALYPLLHIAAIDILLVPAWSTLILFAAYALSRLPSRAATALSLAIFSMICVTFIQNFRLCDYHEDYSAYDYLLDVTGTLPEEGRLALVPGAEENYIFLYSSFGPAGKGASGWGKNGEVFSPYPIAENGHSSTYGLLHAWPGKGMDKADVWEKIRSFPLPVPASGESVLTRDIFKANIFSRIALQRGHALFEAGKAEDSKGLYAEAAAFYPRKVIAEAGIYHRWGDIKRAKLMLESLQKVRPSPAASALLLRLRDTE